MVKMKRKVKAKEQKLKRSMQNELGEQVSLRQKTAFSTLTGHRNSSTIAATPRWSEWPKTNSSLTKLSSHYSRP